MSVSFRHLAAAVAVGAALGLPALTAAAAAPVSARRTVTAHLRFRTCPRP